MDVRVYARAAASIFGLDRFNQQYWQQMEKALGKVEAKAVAKETPNLIQRQTIKAADPYL